MEAPPARGSAGVLWPGPEVGRWAAIAGAVAAVLLDSVGLIAAHLRGDFWAGNEDGVLAPHHDFGDVMYVFRPVPGWMGRVALLYALLVTFLSVALQAAAIALPVLLCAALIETYVTPGWIAAAGHRPVIPMVGTWH